MANSFNSSTREGRGVYKLETSLIYTLSSRTTRARKRDPVSTKTNTHTQKQRLGVRKMDLQVKQRLAN